MKDRYFAAVGYGNEKKEPNVLVFSLDESEKMKIHQKFYCEGGPSYSVKKNPSIVYVALEYKNAIAMYEWKANRLTEKKCIHLSGEGLCHLALTDDDTTLIGSCYMSGDFFTVQTDLTSVIKIKSGNKDSHAHCSKQNGDRVYLIDLGEGKISSYCLKSPKELFVDEFIIEKNEGPRQILNWKHGMFAAVINEQSSTISYWKLDQDGKPAKRLCTINTTQKDEKNAPGDACIWKDRLLFVGNRGSETIAAFSLEKLGEKIGEWDCYGSFPRGLIITEDDYIIVSCQKSGTVITFKWDYENKTILKCDSLYLPGATNVIELTSEEDEK